MPKLTSAVNVHSRTFAAHAAHNRALVDDLGAKSPRPRSAKQE